MSNKCKEIDIKNCACYFFDDSIDVKSVQMESRTKVFLFMILDT